MGQIYRDPLPEVLNPGIFAKVNTKSIDPDSSDFRAVTHDLIFDHFTDNRRLGRPTILNAVVLASRKVHILDYGASPANNLGYNTPVVTLRIRIPGLEVNPPPCAIPVEPNIYSFDPVVFATRQGTTDPNVGTRSPAVNKDAWNIINLHQEAKSEDLLIVQQPLPVPGSTVQVKINEQSMTAYGVVRLEYVGPVLGTDVPFPEIKDPPPVPGDCPPQPENSNEQPPPSGSENPCIKIPIVPKATGKIPTAKTPGPPPVTNKVWGGYGSDSGIITGTKVTANPRGGTVGFQAKRNRAQGGGQSADRGSVKYKQRGDNSAFARLRSKRLTPKLLKYIEGGGSGKANPDNKPLAGTISFNRVKNLMQLPTIFPTDPFTESAGQSGLNPLEKWIVSVIAAAEDQSDRPYNLQATGYAPPGSGCHCSSFVNNVRTIAYVLFHADGKNQEITGLDLSTFDKTRVIRSSLIFDAETREKAAAAGLYYPELFLNIVNPRAVSMQDKNEQTRLKVKKPSINSSPAVKAAAYKYGVHEGSLCGPKIWKSEGKFSPWKGTPTPMPGDIIMPRAMLKIQALLTGPSAFEVKPGQKIQLPFWAKRASMVGHITYLFCGPNGVLMNGESGGAFSGTGAMPFEDYVIRNTHAKTAGDWFPSEFLIMECPEMTQIWKKMGGRPTEPWTPEMFKDLCPNLAELPEFAQYLS